MASMRQNIARALIKTRIGLTTSELSDDLQLKPAVIGMDLAKMAIEGTAQKGEYLEGEGQLWIITEKGVETYATKEDLEVKPPVETSQAKPKNKPLSEVKSLKMPEKSPLAQNEKTVVETVESEPIVEECPLEQNESEPVAEQITVTYEDGKDFDGESFIAEKTESDVLLNPELFELVKTIDENNAKIYELFTKKPKQIILNRENKINALHKLCGSGILSNGTVTILNDIIGDLQVE